MTNPTAKKKAGEKDTTGIEWTATLLPEGLSESDRQWIESLGCIVFPDVIRPGRWLVAGYTHNAWWGCTKWAEGCANCYAETFSKRVGRDIWGRSKERWRTSEKNRRLPYKWNQISKELFVRFGVRLKVFCGSMMDWADSEVSQEWRDDLFRVIEDCQYLDWLMLTKRLEVKPWEPYESGVERMAVILPEAWQWQWPQHVFFGHSIACQSDADKIRAQLRSFLYGTSDGAVKTFISYGPAIGPVNWNGFEFVDQIICEGESGGNAREFWWEWATTTLEWCRENDVAFFMKQVGVNAWKRTRTMSMAAMLGVIDRPDFGEREDRISVTKKGGLPEEWPEMLPREYIN